MDVEIPLSGEKIASLRVSQRGGSFDRACDAALNRNDDAGSLVRISGPVKMGRGGVARQSGIGDRIRQLLGRGVVGCLQVSGAIAVGRRYRLRAFRLPLRLTVSANAVGVLITSVV